MTVPAHAFYLHGEGEPIYALYHPLAAAQSGPLAPTAVGVLLCPLFGNDDLCSYRARREWALTLADGGHPTLRIDLPSTGDSAGGPHDPGRLRAWVTAVGQAARWLSRQPECARVCAIGVGLGGLLAYAAASEAAEIDDLVLWSVPARGRTFVRELRVLSRLEASRATASNDGGGLPDGALASAGFLLSAETLAALDALDLSTLALPDAQRRRVLLLDRDGLDVDARLRGAIEETGAHVTVAPGPGYGRMVTPPQQSQAPREVFATVSRWLAEAPSDADERAPGAPPEPEAAPMVALQGGGPGTAANESDTLELTVEGAHIRETPIAISRGEGRLVGVLAEPDGPASMCAVLLNSGALRHIGQNRMWVEVARRWAARGVPTVRIDLAGIGDSDGDAGSLEQDAGLYVPRYVVQTHEVLDALAARGLPERFVLAGLCSGAYWSLHAALEDERVRAAFMINPRALFWHWTVGGLRDARNLRKALRADTWYKLARGQITPERARTVGRGVAVAVRSLPSRAIAARRARLSGGDELDRALDQLQASDTQVLAVFTDAEPLLDELRNDGGLDRMRRRPNWDVVTIPGPLTSHTLEPLLLQRRVNEILDEALARARTGAEQLADVDEIAAGRR
jgi:alpha/beta superfamily hydrolase